MAAILDVWVTKPGDPCYVDDHPWIVRVFDCAGHTYHWASKDYSSLSAPQAHWADTIPPGIYVVQAEGKDANGKAIYTDHAIAHVGCEGYVCVELFVAGSKTSKPCQIKITEVTGIGAPNPTSIQVNGTAVNCSQVKVTVSCRTELTGAATVPVSGGNWTADISTRNLRCKCGRKVLVQAACVEDPNCKDEFQSELKCTEPPGATSG
jgi:hypothetical protein